MESLYWGAVLRFVQAFVQATPTILVGLIVAGVFRRLLGHSGTRRLFGDNTWRSLPQAWVVGMLLPVCSLGVIPVVRQMRRAGVSGGAILAFGLTAPLFNPISVLYGLTLADPVVIIAFSFCSLVIVTVVGMGWDKLFPGTVAADPEPSMVAPGAKRMLSVAIFGARELAGPSSLYIAAGLLGVAALSLILPAGYLQTAAEHNDPFAPLFMTAVAIPAYATPMTAMVQLASMFQHGNSVGAAFALLALGAGANVGLVAWMVHIYGLRRSAAWFALLVAVVVGLAYGVDKPLYPHGVEPAGHTHAFDIYCAPFQPGTSDAFSLAWRMLCEKIAPHEIVALVVAGGFLAVGLGLRQWDRGGRLEQWLERHPAKQPRGDIVLPGPVLGGIALVGLIGVSVFGCYVYYPPPSEILEEMRIVNTEVASAASSQDWDTALYWIPIYDDWTRKLEVSMFLRGEKLTPYRRAKANVLRDKLELLEHEVEDQEVEQARALGMSVNQAYRRLRDAYSQ
ncbi:MAG: permease [Pirellulaceae bacterium]|nr:MAG: permease [Pirellulaceae bacterium]